MVSHKNKFNIGNGSGFGIVAVLAVCGVLVVVGLSGWVVYRHDHKTVKMGTTSVSQSSPKKMPVADPYAGWKTYCDSYNYCLQYPTGWKLTVASTATKPCDVGQVLLASPDGSVDINYLNDNNKDGATTTLTAVSTTKPISANQDLTIVGGYTPYGTQYLPSYGMADTSLLRTYPVTPNQSGAFLSTPRFTDEGTGSNSCQGSLVSQSIQAFDTSAEAKAWFATPLARTSLKILESFNYKP